MTLTIRPQRRAFMPGTTRRMARENPNSLVSSCVRRPASVSASKRPEYICPALFTRMSTWPKRCVAATTTRSTSASTDMSAATVATSPQVVTSSSPRVSSRVVGVRAQISTRAPASSSVRAVSRPIPRLPPVTMAALPLIPRSIAGRFYPTPPYVGGSRMMSPDGDIDPRRGCLNAIGGRLRPDQDRVPGLIAPERHIIRGEIRILDQRVTSLDQKLDQKVDGLRAEMISMEGELLSEIRRVDTRIDGVSSRIDGVEREVRTAMDLRERLAPLEARRS